MAEGKSEIIIYQTEDGETKIEVSAVAKNATAQKEADREVLS